MKYLYFFFSSFIGLSSYGQFSLSTGYSLGLPQQELNKNINALHSISLGGMYTLPGQLSRISVGADVSWGTYASTSKEQTFRFGNGTSTRTQVNYGSNVIQANATARINLLDKKLYTPYISGKAGYNSFYSTIFIEDPNDLGGCEALDQSTLLKDGTFSTAVGGGLQLDWSLFDKSSHKRRTWIDISVHSINGGNIEYINTKKLYDSNNPPTGSDGKPLTTKFINATTNEIHEHQIAEVFNTPLKMLQFKVAAVFSL